MQPLRKPILQQQRYTYEDYCTWDDGERWELIDGIAYAMAPAPPTSHQGVSRDILLQIGGFLRGKKCEVFGAPFDVRLNSKTKNNTVVQPDLVVICDKSKIDNKGCDGAPDMVVEILSPSSVSHDVFRKYALYQKAGVREYWIVDPDAKTVVTHILKDGVYSGMVYEQSDIVPVSVLDGCTVNLAEVFEERDN